MTITREVARHLGYTIEQRTVASPGTRDEALAALTLSRWFCAPNGTPSYTTYGHGFEDEAGALGDAERRAAYRLGCTVEELRDHAVRLLGHAAVA